MLMKWIVVLPIVLLPSIFCAETPKTWAVLAAGSNTWWNYRHQADVCHAYQVLRAHGVPEEQIIVMMFDDIALNVRNPWPGVIINRVGGPNVYKDVKIDYSGDDVNPDTFKKVLLGDSAGLRGVGTGRVLKSGPNDNVFINFVDHGAPGIVLFGMHTLSASELHDTITKMNQKKMYSKMLFYLESCESGSMFENLLPKELNVFATTAANPHESSWACYFDNATQTYLGDFYSVKWMEDADREQIGLETLEHQYEIVKKEVNKSHVMEYGNLGMSSLLVGEFLGQSKRRFDSVQLPDPTIDAVSAKDVKINILQNQLEAASTESQKRILEKEINDRRKQRQKISAVFSTIVGYAVDQNPTRAAEIFNVRRKLVDLKCYMPLFEHLNSACPAIHLTEDQYALGFLYTFVNMCAEKINQQKIQKGITFAGSVKQICQ